jgi:predicted nucleotidyltransferase
MSLLPKILSSRIRADIFRLLFGVNQNDLHMRDIERRSGFAIGTIQSELKKLVDLDLVIKRRDGNRLYFRANVDHPLYPDIKSIVLKTSGLVDVLKDVMGDEPNIQAAFVYGSIAANEEKAASDVDLMVIGQIGLRYLTKLLSGAAENIGREINPHVLTSTELLNRRREDDHFINQVMDAPKIFIVGNEHDLENVA